MQGYTPRFFPVLVYKSWESNSVEVHSFLPVNKQGEKSGGVHSKFHSSISESNSVGVHSFLPVEKSAGVHFFPVLSRFGKALLWGYALS